MIETTTGKKKSKYAAINWNGGRKKLFPDTEIVKRTVTLPVEVWDYIFTIDSSISRAIFEIATKHQNDND